jgi:hypothetical protein
MGPLFSRLQCVVAPLRPVPAWQIVLAQERRGTRSHAEHGNELGEG